MKIQVKCDCGKVLYVPAQYAGKRGRCPQCARLLTVPEKKDTSENQSVPVKVCPTCGSYLSPDAVVCVACQMNLKTGQWNMAENISYRWNYIWKRTLLLILGYAIVIGLPIFAYLLWQHFYLPRIDYSIWNTGYSNIEKMPEDSDINIQKKIIALQELWQKLPKNISSSFQKMKNLQEKKDSKKIWDPALEIELQKEKNLLARCWKWKIADEKFHQPITEQNLRAAEQNLIQFLREKQGEIHQLNQEERRIEIFTRVTPRLILLFEEACQNIISNPELSTTWQTLRETYQNLDAQETKIAPHTSNMDDNNIKQYTDKLPQVIIEFEDYMKIREYQQAQQHLEKFWQDLHSLQNINSENTVVAEVRNRLKEVQSVRVLFSIANEGARSNIGLNKAIFSKDGKVYVGKIMQYALENFYIQGDDGKVSKIALKNLQPEEIVFFAINSQKNKHIYEYAGIFYFYERKFSLSQQSFISALRHGANDQEIKKYLQRVHGEVSKNSNEK